MHDPAIVQSGPREAIDGHRFLARAVGFGRELRRAGLAVDVGAEIDFARALGVVDIGDREVVRAAGAAVFTRRRDDRPVYDRVFDRYWRRRSLQPNLEAPGSEQRPEAVPSDEGTPQDGATPGDERSELPEDRQGIPIPSDGDPDDDSTAPDIVTISPDAYSKSETMRHRDFDRMTAQELRDAERLVDLLEPKLELRRTRRYELHRHGRRLAPRAMFRANLGNGGEVLSWVWRRKIQRPRPLVVLCDISGSMERHSRLLLRFVQALSASSTVKTESFVFGTRLTRVTRLLKDRNRDRALARVADTVTDWAGGNWAVWERCGCCRVGDLFPFFLRVVGLPLRSLIACIRVCKLLCGQLHSTAPDHNSRSQSANYCNSGEPIAAGILQIR